MSTREGLLGGAACACLDFAGCSSDGLTSESGTEDSEGSQAAADEGDDWCFVCGAGSDAGGLQVCCRCNRGFHLDGPCVLVALGYHPCASTGFGDLTCTACSEGDGLSESASGEGGSDSPAGSTASTTGAATEATPVAATATAVASTPTAAPAVGASTPPCDYAELRCPHANTLSEDVSTGSGTEQGSPGDSCPATDTDMVAFAHGRRRPWSPSCPSHELAAEVQTQTRTQTQP